MKTRRPIALALGLLTLGAAALSSSAGRAQSGDQTILGPGLYVFQTRTRTASCDDDERTGYVSTFIAPIHGVPGSRTMRMQLTNSEYWPSWQLTVADGAVSGESRLAGSSGANAPTNRFSVRPQGDRFTGRGTRTYTRTEGGRSVQCQVEFDALLRRIDML